MGLLWSSDTVATAATYDASTGLWYVALEGYRSTTSSRPSVIHVVDPSKRMEVGRIEADATGRGVNRLRVEGKSLYCLTSGGAADTAMRVFDLTDPIHPLRILAPARLVVKAGDTTAITAADFAVRNGVVLSEQGFSGGIVVDYRSPSAPKVLAEGGGLNGGYSGLVSQMIPVDSNSTIMNDGYANHWVTWNASGSLQYKKWHYLSQLNTQKGAVWHAPTGTYLQNWNAPGDTVALRWWRGADSGWLVLGNDDPSLSGYVPGLALDGDDLWIPGKDSASLLKYDLSAIPPRFAGKYKGSLSSARYGWGGTLFAEGGMVLVTRGGAGSATHLYDAFIGNSGTGSRRGFRSDLSVRSSGGRILVRNSGSRNVRVQILGVSGRILDRFSLPGSTERTVAIPGGPRAFVFVAVQDGRDRTVKGFLLD